jgi:anthranilate phosphoribosyltransferase
VCLNAAAGIVAGGKAETLRDGFQLACESIARGKALAALEGLVEATQAA